MQLKYDLYTINNAMGSGKSRQYVRLILREPLTARELETVIEKRCSLTRGDVADVLTELRDLCVQAFIEGRRFYIPEIGYLSLAASLNVDDNNADRKVTGNDVRIAGINFRPEASLVKEVSQGVRFVRTKHSNQSSQYTEQQMSEQVKAYLQDNAHAIWTNPISSAEMAQSFMRRGGDSERGCSAFPVVCVEISRKRYCCLLSCCLFRYSFSHSSSHILAVASLGIRQSPRGLRLTLPTFGPSGRHERLNCWAKKRRRNTLSQCFISSSE